MHRAKGIFESAVKVRTTVTDQDNRQPLMLYCMLNILFASVQHQICLEGLGFGVRGNPEM